MPTTRTARLGRAAAALVLVAAAALAVAAGTTVAAPPSNSARPTISGTARQGQTLHAEPGNWNDATSFRYQWYQCDSGGNNCTTIPGADQQDHNLKAEQVGRRIRVLVTASGPDGSNSVFSDATDVVAPASPGPVLLAAPVISGTPRSGATLTATTGSWNGTGTVSYRYQWLRCDTHGDNCQIASAPVEQPSVVLTPADVGRTIRVKVLATDSNGTTDATSASTGVVTPQASGVPVPTAAPKIGGTPVVGARLSTTQGTWTGAQPIAYTIEWQRCNPAGGACATIAGANATTYDVKPEDAGKRLRTNVTAQNGVGRQNAYSSTVLVPATPAPAPAPAPAPQPQAPSGIQRLANGLTSVGVDGVALPQRLVISRVSFTPVRMPPGQPVTLTVTVSDTRGYRVRDALVYVVGVPFARIATVPEVRTQADGTARLLLQPTARMPRRSGASLVLFVRARKPGGQVLAGVSTRRLVQITVQ